jgi:DNA-binding MarR family transcriptional regulator
MSDADDGRLDPELVLPRLLQLSGALNRGRLIETALERVGIPLERPALSVLITLRGAGQPLRVGEIAARMDVVGPHVTRTLHDMERRGLVRRTPDPDDQRARLVELTPDGSAAVGRYLQAVLDRLTEALGDWTEDDRRTFGRLLARFVDDLTARLTDLD